LMDDIVAFDTSVGEDCESENVLRVEQLSRR
jgi:hypothetical protein